MVLNLLESGVDPKKIELHHHDVDGNSEQFIDWPCTKDYCRIFAQSFNLPIYFSWREGGFKREMLRNNQRTAPIQFETPNGLKTISSKGKQNTRLKFPQQSADLRVRWCSSYLKISVLQKLINNSPRFLSKKTLVLTGERAEESAARAKYKQFETHPTHRCKRVKRHVDHARPILTWTTKQVWDKLKQYRIFPHPAYWLGWGRCSCAGCIFINNEDWATLHNINFNMVEKIAEFENQFQLSITRPKNGVSFKENTVLERAITSTPRDINSFFAKMAFSERWVWPIILDKDITWIYPKGAFADLKSGSP